MSQLTRAQLIAELNSLITDPLNRQNNAARVRQILTDIINSDVNALDDLKGIDLWASGSTGNQSLKANNNSGIDAQGDFAVAEGFNTLASGNFSHAEGADTKAIGNFSHAEGYNTQANGQYSHSEGELTIANGTASFAGGRFSQASGTTSFAFGLANAANGDYSVVLGGYDITGNTDSTVYVPYLNIQSANTDNTITNILGQDSNGNISIVQLSAVSSSSNIWSASTGANSIIANNGTGNIASGDYSMVAGLNNSATGQTTYSTILNGKRNVISTSNSLIGGGFFNSISSTHNSNIYGHNSIVGGISNTINNAYGYSIIGGGTNNLITNDHSVVVGGNSNSGTSHYNFIGSGLKNLVAGGYSSVLNGVYNLVAGNYSSVLGGKSNSGMSLYSNIVNGASNYINSNLSSIVGGNNNRIINNSRGRSFIGGGAGNYIGGYESVIAGGIYNTVAATAPLSLIVGGSHNTASNPNSVVIAGYNNIASNVFSTIINGSYNIANGIHSTVFGNSNNAQGTNSSILGGQNNITSSAATNSFILGANITGVLSNSTYTENAQLAVNAGNKIYSAGTPLEQIFSSYNSDIPLSGTTTANTLTGVIIHSNGGNDALATNTSGGFNIGYGNDVSNIYGSSTQYAAASFDQYQTYLQFYDNVTNTGAELNLAGSDGSGGNGTFAQISAYNNIAQSASKIAVGAGSIVISGFNTGTTNAFAGIQYGADFSPYYTNRSLVDKNYVDTHSATATTTAISGTINFLPVFNSTNTVVNSILQQSTATGLTVFGSVEIYGNVTIAGTASTFDTQTIQTESNNISMNLSGSHVSALAGGITVLSGRPDNSNSTFTIDSTGTWSANTGMFMSALTVNSGSASLINGSDTVTLNAGHTSTGTVLQMSRPIQCTTNTNNQIHYLSSLSNGNINIQGSGGVQSPVLTFGINSTPANSNLQIFAQGSQAAPNFTIYPVGVTVGSTAVATAQLMIVGSTSGTTSLRIQSGVTVSSPNNGDLWNDNTYLNVGVIGLSVTGGSKFSTVTATTLSAGTFTGRFIPRSGIEATNTGTTINTDLYDIWNITALTTSDTITTTGNPNDGQQLTIRIKDNGTSRAVTFSSNFNFSTYLLAPSATTASKTLYVFNEFNSISNKWDVINWQDGY